MHESAPEPSGMTAGGLVINLTRGFTPMAETSDHEMIMFLHRYAADLRTVLETLHEMDPWVRSEDFKSAFTENNLGQLYDDLFESVDA